VGAALVALAAALAAFPFMGKTFMPGLDEGDLLVSVEKLPSISLEQSMATDLRIQAGHPGGGTRCRGIVARTGADEIGLDPMGPNQTDTFLVLKPKGEWRRPDKGIAEQPVARGVRAVSRRGLQLHPAYRDARLGDAHGRARRRGRQGVRTGPRYPQRALAHDSPRVVAARAPRARARPSRTTVCSTCRVVIDRMAAGRLGVPA
jgi:multidrug efflux pump subunit AcrB